MKKKTIKFEINCKEAQEGSDESLNRNLADTCQITHKK